MKTALRTEAKKDFEKDFFKLMNNSVFGKTMENVRNHRDIKLVRTSERRNKLVSEPNYHTTKHFFENVLAIEMRKTKIKMNKLAYVGQAILDIGKIFMYEFWYGYIKPKYGDKARLCYMDTDSFIIHVEIEDFYKDIASDIDKWYDTSGYDENDKGPLPIAKNKKIIGFFKDELNGKIMTKLCGPGAKTYSSKIDDDNKTEKKKAKGTKKCVMKRRLKFPDYYDSVFKNETILRSQLRFKNDHHTIYTKNINKIATSSNDDKRIQTYDKVATCPHGTSVFKVCQTE